MLAYLKSHRYDDAFVAGMRGVGVVTGLLGTLAMPLLEKRVGLVRAGTWSILCVVPRSTAASPAPDEATQVRGCYPRPCRARVLCGRTS